ncbi:MAG TPA: hypothetical protein VEZ48_08530 [Sphingomonadaceae bacterium]|nr:hypothetical protein [Sphingomonadaceae bacterium]
MFDQRVSPMWDAMNWRAHWKAAGRIPLVRKVLFLLGCLLLASAPILGPIPGPGGLIVAAAGMTLILRNSRWAKRRYVHFKRWQPRAGSWFDWGLRRGSARRRDALAKLQERLPPHPPHPWPD